MGWRVCIDKEQVSARMGLLLSLLESGVRVKLQNSAERRKHKQFLRREVSAEPRQPLPTSQPATRFVRMSVALKCWEIVIR